MTGNPEVPASGRAPDAAADRPRSGRVTELALVAACLGFGIYLVGFADEVGLGAVVGPLLLGGGLLAGAVALPSVSARLLVPAAVSAVTGTLFVLQAVVEGADGALAIAALVLALLESAALVGAVLVQVGTVSAPRPKAPKAAAAGPYPGAYPQQPGFPGQQYPGQPYPGQQYPGEPYPGAYAAPYPGAAPAVAPPGGAPAEQYPGDQYAGEHAYAQNARYGAQYGVPGYPPPPYGAAGQDPAVSGTGGYAAHRSSGASDGPSSAALFGDPAPADDPSAASTTVVQTSGAHRVRSRSEPAPGPAETPRSDDATTVVQTSGTHRARARADRLLEPVEEPRADDPVTVVQATGAHRARRAQPEDLPDEPRPDEPAPTGGPAVPDRPDGADDADARTRAIPRVTDER